MSEQQFEMALCVNTVVASLSPPTCSPASDAAVPWFCVDFGRLVPASLSNAINNRIKVWAVGWPLVNSSEFGNLTFHFVGPYV